MTQHRNEPMSAGQMRTRVEFIAGQRRGALTGEELRVALAALPSLADDVALVLVATDPVLNSWARLSREKRDFIRCTAPDLAEALDELVRGPRP